MSGRYLLDTNTIVAFLNGDSATGFRMNAASELLLSSVALGELHFGAANSARPGANLARIEDFALSCTVVPVGAETARLYGQLKAELKKTGRPIPENDPWIAACALEHTLVLVTRDHHFERIGTLQTEAW